MRNFSDFIWCPWLFLTSFNLRRINRIIFPHPSSYFLYPIEFGYEELDLKESGCYDSNFFTFSHLMTYMKHFMGLLSIYPLVSLFFTQPPIFWGSLFLALFNSAFIIKFYLLYSLPIGNPLNLNMIPLQISKPIQCPSKTSIKFKLIMFLIVEKRWSSGCFHSVDTQGTKNI